MRRSVIKSSRILLSVVLTLASASAIQAQVTNWVAYNDHRPGPIIPPHISSPTNWGTAERATTHNMGAPADSIGVNLINYLTGAGLTATVTFARTGAPDDFGTVVRPLPTNTPAARLFYRVCDLANDGIVGVDAVDGDFVTITFNNLNPAKRYVFRGTAGRNGGYAARWSVAKITANSWIDAHQSGSGPGVITSNGYPNLVEGEAAWNSGHNAEGAVIGWDFITPAADGSFSITCKQYVGPTPNGGAATDANYGYSFGVMLLAEVEVAAPVITAHPVSTLSIEQNRPFSLSVTASGTPLQYQWYKEGSGEIAGATLATYSVPQATLSESGNYYAVVYNPLGRATSSVASVTVNADVTKPGIAVVVPFPSVTGGIATHNQLVVEFTEPVTSASVSSPGSYTVPGGGNPVSVVVTNDRTVVLTLASPLAEDTAYTMSASGMTDLVGNTAGSVSASFRTWVSGPGNGLLFEAFDTATTPGVDLPLLTSNPNYPNNPYLRATLSAFDTRDEFAGDTTVDYGARIRGVFIPPVSGNWVFFLRTYDRGAVFLNPNGLDPDGAIEILRESSGNDPRNWDKFTSAIFPLQAGQGYYIEGQYKADVTAPDVMKVAARLAGTGFPTDLVNSELDPNSISGGAIGYPLAPKDLGGTLSISQGPVNTTVEENHFATFSVTVNNPSKSTVFYQWYRDGVEIPNGNGQTYSVQVTPADSAATFSVQVAKVGSSATSGSATLTVITDVTPPSPISATTAATNLNEVVVVFDELVTQSDVEDEFNFAVLGDNPVSAILDPDGKTVRLIFATALLQDASYQIEVSNVTDLKGLVMTTTTLSFIAGGSSSRPTLTIAQEGANVVVSWPATAAGYNLESTDNLVLPITSITWTAVGTPPTVENGQNTVRVPIAGNRYFRLKQ